MNDKIYLPNKNNKAYTPSGVAGLMRKAEKENNGNLEAIFRNKHKYKNLIEMYHAGFLALSLYKWLGKKFLLVSSDAPDLYFVEDQGTGAFPVEVMELFKYKGNFHNYKELANHIWETKGKINYKECHLLLVSRLSMQKFNITKFVKELDNFKWFFERIWLSAYTKAKNQWMFFEVFPPAQHRPYDSNYIYFNFSQDKRFFY